MLLEVNAFYLNSDYQNTAAKTAHYYSESPITSKDVLEIALACNTLGMTVLSCEPDYTNIPSNDVRYMSFVVLRSGSSTAVIMFGYNTGNIFVNCYANGNWTGWKTK